MANRDTQPPVSVGKAREQQIGAAFIDEFNRVCNTNFVLDLIYDDEFPDLRFKSPSGSEDDLLAEVVQVIETEEQQAKDSFVDRLQRKLRAELQKRECVGIVVAIQYLSLPAPSLVKAWLNCVSRYVEHKRRDLKRREFKFDSAIDGRSFWEMSHISGSIRGIQIRLTDTSDEICVFLTSKGRRIFPAAYLKNAIHKKAKKYAHGSIKGIILLLDCNFSRN